MLAIGAGGGCVDIFSLLSFLFFLPLCETEILAQRAVKLRTTNKPNLDGLGIAVLYKWLHSLF